MNLRDRKLEARIRRVRGARMAEIGKYQRSEWNPFTERFFRKHRNVPSNFSRLILRCVILFAVLLPNMMGKSASIVAVIIGCWAFAMLVWQSAMLVAALRGSTGLYVMAHLPLSNEEVFSIQSRRFLARSAWMMVDFSLLIGALAAMTGFGVSSLWIGPILGAFQWLGVMAMISVFVALVPGFGWVRRIFFWLAAGAAAGLASSWYFFHVPVWSYLSRLFTGMPPTGLILGMLGARFSGAALGAFGNSLAMGIVLAAWPLATRKLRAEYNPPLLDEDAVVPSGANRRVQGIIRNAGRGQGRRAAEFWKLALSIRKAFLPSGKNKDTESQAGGVAESGASSEAEVAELVRIRERIRSGDYLAPHAPRPEGWAGKVLGGLLTSEEWNGCLAIQGGVITTRRLLATLGIITILLMVIPYLVVKGLFTMVAYASLFFGQAILRTIGLGAGFGVQRSGSIETSICSYYPVAVRTITRCMIKLTMFHVVAAIILALIFSPLYGKMGVPGFPFGFMNCLRVLALVLALIPIVPLARISSTSNDTRSPKILGCVLLMAACLIGGGLTLYLAKSATWAVTACIFMNLATWGTLWGYIRAYNKLWFDLERTAPGKQQDGAA